MMAWFSEKMLISNNAYMVSCAQLSKNLERYLMSIYAAIRPYIHFVLQVRTHYNIHQSKLARLRSLYAKLRKGGVICFLASSSLRKKKWAALVIELNCSAHFEEVCTIHSKVHIFWEGHKKMTKSPIFFWIYEATSKLSWKFRHIFVAFSEYMNFT